ncbi:MAG: hypothetical protein ACSHW6_14965 [Sulfitobacter geojensis]
MILTSVARDFTIAEATEFSGGEAAQFGPPVFNLTISKNLHTIRRIQ